jgi:hypothetical protein
MKNEDAPILLIGGYGSVGSEAARTLRRLYPNTRLVIAGRDHARAIALAAELGHAEAEYCDLAIPTLGLDSERRYRGIVVFAKDESLHALGLSIAQGSAYVSISEYAVEIAPLVARATGEGRHIPILLLSHHLGGLVTMVALQHASAFSQVEAIRVGAVFDADDLGGATAQADAARVARITPHPLLLEGGRWLWGYGPQQRRCFVDVEGIPRDGVAFSLLDVPSIAAATKARSVRFDVAIREATKDYRSRHEVVIEIDGISMDHRAETCRVTIQDAGFHTGMSGRTIAFALERLLGLDGQPRMQAGFNLPENALNAKRIISLARASGILINSQTSMRLREQVCNSQ